VDERQPEWIVEDDELPPAEDDSGNGSHAEPLKLSERKWPVITANELLTRDWPEPSWLVPGILPVGLCYLAGRPKVGKSWLAIQLAQAVCKGGVFLNEAVSAAPVLYLALEDQPRRLANRMKAQGWQAGAGVGDFMGARGARSIGPLNKGGANKLVEIIHANAYRLVIIDTFSRLFTGDQNEGREITAALGPLQQEALSHEMAVMIIDHHNKMGAANPGTTDGDNLDPVTNILGSTAKAALCDCIWGLYKQQGKGGATLAITGRDVDDRRLSLWYDKATSCWQAQGDSDMVKVTKGRAELMKVLADLGKATATEIANAIGRDRGNVHRSLQELVQAKILDKEDDYYVLPRE
jgi:hypothetical protein